MQIIHRMITYILNARDQSNGQVTLWDLALLDMAFHNHQVDITHWLVYKISQIKDVVDGVVGMDTLIIVIA